MDQPTEKHWRTGTPIVLRFPVPLSQNKKNAIAWKSSKKYTRLKNEAKHAAYYLARSQLVPPRPIAAHVHVHAHFQMHNLRDEDKLGAGLEWILDALKGEYFLDDDPQHMILICTQEICRDVDRQGVTLTITPA